MYVPVSQSILFNHVAELCDGLGINYRAGEEGSFFSSLYQEGLRAQDLSVLNRLLQGRAVKLEDYRTVVRDLSRLCDDRMALDAVRRRYEDARERFELCHESAVAALETRGLLDRFAVYAIGLQPDLCEQGYEPAGGFRDVAYEFRCFVERGAMIDLLDVARQYDLASATLAREKSFWEIVQESR